MPSAIRAIASTSAILTEMAAATLTTLLSPPLASGAVVLLVTAAAQGLQRATINELCERFGVSRRTVKRWVQFFLVSFPRSDAWRRLRGHVSASVGNHLLPRSFLEWLFGERECTETALRDALRLIACGP